MWWVAGVNDDLNLATVWIYGCYSVDKVANSQAKAKLVIEILDILKNVKPL